MKIVRYGTVTSTQDVAKELIGKEKVPFAVISKVQLQGRGREGRRWHSPLGGFWATIVVKGISLLQFRGSLAVIDACRSYGAEPKIKWPNDVVFKGKKLAGVMVEAHLGYQLLGIGVNVNNDPPIDYAISLKEILGSEIKGFEDRFFHSLEKKLNECEERILDELRKKCETIGKDVVVYTKRSEIRGKAIGIGDLGELIVRSEGRTFRIFFAEVRRVREIRHIFI